MPTSDTKALVSEYIEAVWNKADMTALHELTLATYTYRLGLSAIMVLTTWKVIRRTGPRAFLDGRVRQGHTR